MRRRPREKCPARLKRRVFEDTNRGKERKLDLRMELSASFTTEEKGKENQLTSRRRPERMQRESESVSNNRFQERERQESRKLEKKRAEQVEVQVS